VFENFSLRVELHGVFSLCHSAFSAKRFGIDLNEVWVIAYELRFLYNVLARQNLRPIKTFETTDFADSTDYLFF